MKKIIIMLALAFAATVGYSKEICKVSFAEAKMEATGGMEVLPGPGTYYNSYYGNSWLMHYQGVSYLSVSFSLTDEEAVEERGLNVTHLSSLVNGECYSPVNIYVNGEKLLDHYDPHSGNWVYDQFDISQNVRSGDNDIRIELCNGALGNYWINALSIQ